jgi:hypothetical protein
MATTGPISYNTNLKSNLDSVHFNTGDHANHPSAILYGIWGCSFNSYDFPNNSSVRFYSPPIYSFQAQKPIEFNPGPYDPDHDSVVLALPDTLKGITGMLLTEPWDRGVFSKTDVYGNPCPDLLTDNFFFAPLPGQTGPNPIRFNSQNNPFDTDSSFHLVDSTGKVTFTAASIMEPVLYYSAKDYRNGQFVSETYYINQFDIQADGRLPSYMRIDTGSVQNASFNNQGTLLGCKGYPISFDAYVKLPNDPSGDLIVTTTADTTVPGNGACVLSGLNTDSVHMKFTWTPPMNAKGLYNVFITAKDSNCNAPFHEYTQVYTWSFYIDSCKPSAVNDVVKDDGIKLYPNPSKGEFTIMSSEDFKDVKIFNSVSELVFEKKTKPTKKLQLNVGLPEGIYFVHIDGKYVRKLLIER